VHGARSMSVPGCRSRLSTRQRSPPDSRTELAEDLSVALLLTLDRLSPLDSGAVSREQSGQAAAFGGSGAARRRFGTNDRVLIRVSISRDEGSAFTFPSAAAS
jgi:hypothetical protein